MRLIALLAFAVSLVGQTTITQFAMPSTYTSGAVKFSGAVKLQ